METTNFDEIDPQEKQCYLHSVVAHYESNPGRANNDWCQTLDGMLDKHVVIRVQVVGRAGCVPDDQVQEPGQAESKEGEEVFALATFFSLSLTDRVENLILKK